jgi:hypothetical protein
MHAVTNSTVPARLDCLYAAGRVCDGNLHIVYSQFLQDDHTLTSRSEYLIGTLQFLCKPHRAT